MSNIGYYRYKSTFTSNTKVNFTTDGDPAGTKTVVVKGWCTGDILLKYLNKNGQYRFFPFNQYWEREDKPKEIGRASKIVTSLLTSQASEITVGYKNERRLNLVAEGVTQEELDILVDIYTSPKVYMYIGTAGDTTEDWIEVSVESRKPSSKIKKGNSKDIELTVLLPEWYSIGLL